MESSVKENSEINIEKEGSESEDSEISNFIFEAIKKDISAGGRFEGAQVHTRFPPEPNGYLHIGHAKAICMNFGSAKKFNGICNLRMDDTNPVKEDVEYVDSIKEDVKWLGFDWEDRFYYASDYFDVMFENACDLIKKGLAYVCELTGEEVKKNRGDLTNPAVSPYRDRPTEESLDLFMRMKNGEFPDGKMTLRAKIDLASGNFNMRDPVIYRIAHITHHQTGDKWCVYPMYDFAHPLSDAKEGVTHSLCSLEFENHRPLYDWVLEACEIEEAPRQIEFARLNLNYCLTSKRKCLALVNEGIVDGWDDPRMVTLSGMRRRGYPAKAVRDFCEKIGVSKAYSVVDMNLLEACVRDVLNDTAPRAMAVLDPVELIIENYPEDKTEDIEIAKHPDHPEMGSKTVKFSKHLFVERNDFMAEPVKKYFRLYPGNEVRLKGAYFVTCTSFEADENGKVTRIYCTYDPASKGGESPDGRKVRGTIHWVSREDCFKATVKMYDRLFNVPNPSDESAGDFKQNLNPESLKVIKNCLIEGSLSDAEAGDVFQFMRQGYFCVDKESEPDNKIFNLTVALNSSWK